MPNLFNSNATKLINEVQTQAAKNLLAAAVYFQTHLMKKLGERTPQTKTIKVGKKTRRVFIPPYSKAGEYPMKRTGFLQANIKFEPTNVEAVKSTFKVKVGYGFNASYGAVLEFKMLRLGLIKTLSDLQPYLEKLASAKVVQ